MQLDLIVHNARIVTMDDSRPEAHSMGIWRGIITGFDEQLHGMTAAETFDAGGDCVLPGFIDGHTHCAVTGFRYGALDISTCSDIAAVLDTIGRAAADVEPGGWLDVFGYDQRAYGRDITAVEIDAVVDGRRVWIRHDSSHSSIVSTNVLTAAVAQGWKRAVPTSGLLLEDEQKLVFDQRLPYSQDEIENALINAGERCLADGITMCVEAGIGGGLLSLSGTELAAYQNLAESGRLPVRMQVMVSRDVVHEVSTTDGPQRVIDLGLRTGLGDDWLSIGALKTWLDGGMMVRSAAVTEPYVGTTETGMLVGQRTEVIAEVVGAHRAGWQLALHAIGDRAVDLAIEALQEARRVLPRPDARHRIEHGGLIRDDQLRSLGDLGVSISTQPCFLWHFGDDYANILGPERAGLLYRGRSLLDHGIRLIGSTDRPLPGTPLKAIQFLAQRRTSSGAIVGSDEVISVDEAIAIFTRDAAWGSHKDERLGTLTAGKRADFIVLDDDPRQVPIADISDIGVQRTYIDGVLRWQRS